MTQTALFKVKRMKIRQLWVEINRMVGWLFWVQRPFETVFQSIEREKEERKYR